MMGEDNKTYRDKTSEGITVRLYSGRRESKDAKGKKTSEDSINE